MKEYGEYRPIYTRLVDDPDYQALSPHARLLLFVLKLSLGPIGIAVLPGAHAMLEERTGLRAADLAAAVAELTASDWLRTERSVWWLVNGLRFEPGYSALNHNHGKFIQRTAASLPNLSIVDDFRASYPVWFPGNGTHRKAIAKASECHRDYQTKPNQTRPDLPSLSKGYQQTQEAESRAVAESDPALAALKAEAKARLAEGRP